MMREREWIDRFVRPRAPRADAGGTLLGPGDDAALLAIPPGDVAVLTVDGLIEGRHFLGPWLEDDELAARLVAVTVSDLAAMGANPLGILLSLETPDLPGRLGDRFFAGLDRILPRAGLLLGGNVVRTDGPLALTATAIGSVRPDCALRRDAARAGDVIAVSGLPGRAAAARERISQGHLLTAAERAPWVLPPRSDPPREGARRRWDRGCDRCLRRIALGSAGAPRGERSRRDARARLTRSGVRGRGDPTRDLPRRRGGL